MTEELMADVIATLIGNKGVAQASAMMLLCI